jgi:hypothetical protein
MTILFTIGYGLKNRPFFSTVGQKRYVSPISVNKIKGYSEP